MPANRTFEVKALSRVEGEGALYVKLNGDVVEHVELNIYEPPRFFEGFLRGREIREVPDITARICGICPVAYQMSSCHALEKALGITRHAGDPHAAPAALLRRVDRKPRAAHLPAARARFPRLRERHQPGRRSPRGRREGLADEEDRQRVAGDSRRPGDPSDQRHGWRILPRAEPRRAAGAAARSRVGPAGLRSTRWIWSPVSSFPIWNSTTSASRSSTRLSSR